MEIHISIHLQIVYFSVSPKKKCILNLLSVTVVDGDPMSVVKLRTSTPMFRAYEHVYNLLSYTFLPLFHQSEDVSVVRSW